MLIPTCTIQTKHPLNTPSTHTHERCLTRAFSTWLIATSVGVVACRRDERGEDLHIRIECCFGVLTISSQLCTLERSHHRMPGNFFIFFIFLQGTLGRRGRKWHISDVKSGEDLSSRLAYSGRSSSDPNKDNRQGKRRERWTRDGACSHFNSDSDKAVPKGRWGFCFFATWAETWRLATEAAQSQN